ncbi:phosphatidate cytidylyltransferase [Williamsoniiplasma somnilux]|uniref:Phosphatidate cytidylyltransferase n=1 Tax=Williamsoniiplasma somnilux TaxID=215578 RepID=A0A2K8NY65_9MOLU|nr:phosphatidate cytidylyltransferase [Williamsoniiplasma somnilux]ATZ18684.1 phosphatidate cytidylyltransferase [Williamsoniiplasma somnilux]
MTKIKVNETLHSKKFLNDLTIRLISTSVMLLLLITYVGLSILYTEGIRHNLQINVAVPHYIFVVASMALLTSMVYELIRAIGIKEWYVVIPIIGMALILFYFPISGDLDLLIYKDLKVNEWYKWWQSLILVILIALSTIVFTKFSKAEFSYRKSLILTVVMLLVVFGMKGFNYISLSMNGDIPKYSFSTVIWIWIVIILTDSFAYLGGTMFGKTKLAPSISPKKSVEGAVIGSIVALIIGSLIAILPFYLTDNAAYGPFSVPFYNLKTNIGDWIPGIFLFLLTFVISILAHVGDLFFSAIKRYVNIKDYSKLIPGHGGVLDRLDSFVFVFFFMFLITMFIK